MQTAGDQVREKAKHFIFSALLQLRVTPPEQRSCLLYFLFWNTSCNYGSAEVREDGGASGVAAEMLLGTPTSHQSAWVRGRALLHPQCRPPAPGNEHLGAAMLAQGPGPLPPRREPRTELLAPCFRLPQPWLLWPLESDSAHARSVSHSFCLSNKTKNKLLMIEHNCTK